MKDNNFFFCRICGYRHLEPQWGEDGMSPTYEFCSCCGVEAGNEDYSIESIRRYRADWIYKGAKWYENWKKPANWKLETQMKNIPVEFF